MKKNIVLLFTKILCVLFIVGTIILLVMINKHIDNSAASKFGMCYFFLVLFMVIYIPFITILNSRKLKFVYIRKRLFKFAIMFVLLGILNYVFDYMYNPSTINLFRELSTAFGIAFGSSFIDIIFLKKKEN